MSDGQYSASLADAPAGVERFGVMKASGVHPVLSFAVNGQTQGFAAILGLQRSLRWCFGCARRGTRASGAGITSQPKEPSDLTTHPGTASVSTLGELQGDGELTRPLHAI